MSLILIGCSIGVSPVQSGQAKRLTYGQQYIPSELLKCLKNRGFARVKRILALKGGQNNDKNHYSPLPIPYSRNCFGVTPKNLRNCAVKWLGLENPT
jgi:hypothetical protein